MPKYRVQAPNGKSYEIEAPEGATEEEIYDYLITQTPELGQYRGSDAYADSKGNTYYAPDRNAAASNEKPGFWSSLGTGAYNTLTDTVPAMYARSVAAGLQNTRDELDGRVGLGEKVVEAVNDVSKAFAPSSAVTKYTGMYLEGKRAERRLEDAKSNEPKKEDLLTKGRDALNRYASGQLEDYRRNMQEARVPLSMEEASAQDNWSGYIGSQIGSGLAQNTASLAAMLATRGKVNPLATGLAVGGPQAYGEVYGSAVEAAEAEGGTADDVDMGLVNKYGLAAAGLESVADTVLGAASNIVKIPKGKMADLLSSSTKKERGEIAGRAVNVAKRAPVAFVSEGTTESIQGGFSDMGSGKSFEEASFANPEEFVAGGLGGLGPSVIGNTLSRANPRAPEEGGLTYEDQPEPTNSETVATEEYSPLAEMERINAELQQRKEQERQEVEQQKRERQARRAKIAKDGNDFFTPNQYYIKKLQEYNEQLNDESQGLGAEYAAWRAEADRNPNHVQDSLEARDAFLNDRVIPEMKDATEWEAAAQEYIDNTKELTDQLAGLSPEEQGQLIGELEGAYGLYKEAKDAGNMQLAQQREADALERFGPGGWQLIKTRKQKEEMGAVATVKSTLVKDEAARLKKEEADKKKAELEAKRAQQKANRTAKSKKEEAKIDDDPLVNEVYEAEKAAGSDRDVKFYKRGKGRVARIIKRVRDEFGPDWAAENPNLQAKLDKAFKGYRYDAADKALNQAIAERKINAAQEAMRNRPKNQLGIVKWAEMTEKETELVTLWLGLNYDGTERISKGMSVENAADALGIPQKQAYKMLREDLGYTDENKQLLMEAYAADGADTSAARTNEFAEFDSQQESEQTTDTEQATPDPVEEQGSEYSVLGDDVSGFSIVSTPGDTETQSLGVGRNWADKYKEARRRAVQETGGVINFDALVESMSDAEKAEALAMLENRSNSDQVRAKLTERSKSVRDKMPAVSGQEMDNLYIALVRDRQAQESIKQKNAAEERVKVQNASLDAEGYGDPKSGAEKAWDRFAGDSGIAWEGRQMPGEPLSTLTQGMRLKVRQALASYLRAKNPISREELANRIRAIRDEAIEKRDTFGMKESERIARKQKQAKERNTAMQDAFEKEQQRLEKRRRDALSKEERDAEDLKAKQDAQKAEAEQAEKDRQKSVENAESAIKKKGQGKREVTVRVTGEEPKKVSLNKIAQAITQAALQNRKLTKNQRIKLAQEAGLLLRTGKPNEKAVRQLEKEIGYDYVQNLAKRGDKDAKAFLQEKTKMGQRVAKKQKEAEKPKDPIVTKAQKIKNEQTKEDAKKVKPKEKPKAKKAEPKQDDKSILEQQQEKLEKERQDTRNAALKKFREAKAKQEKDSNKRSRGATSTRTTVARVKEAIKDVISAAFADKVQVYDTVDEAKKAHPDMKGLDDTRAWVSKDGKVFFIAENVGIGSELAVAMHEIGAHIGIGKLYGKDIPNMAKKIRQMAKSGNNMAKTIAKDALQRLELANPDKSVADEELVAYFIESAVDHGVRPKQLRKGGNKFLNFVKDIYDRMVQAVKDFAGVEIELTPQSMVDLAYGAAKKGTRLVDSQTHTGVRFSKQMAQNVADGYEDLFSGIGNDTTKNVLRRSYALTKKIIAETKFFHQFIRKIAPKMPAAKRFSDTLDKAETFKQELRRKVENIAARAGRLSKERRALVNKFIQISTLQGLYGYDVTITRKDKNGVEVKTDIQADPIMEKMFKMLTPEERQIVKDVFAHGEYMLNLKADLARELGQKIGYFIPMGSMNGPYAPLKRYGMHVAWAKSQRVIDLENKIQAAKDNETPPDKADVQELERLKSNPDHYIISFFENSGEAAAFLENLPSGKFARFKTYERHDRKADTSAEAPTLQKMIARMKANKDIPAGAKKAFEDMITDMYLSGLDDMNARNAGRKRKGYAGADENMLRAFLDHAKSESNLVANIKFGREINQHFIDAQQAARESDDPELSEVFNQLNNHYGALMDYQTSKWRVFEDQITTITSVYLLLMSPVYYMQNLTQPWAFTAPRLAGVFGSWPNAMKEMGKGYIGLSKIAKFNPKRLELDVDPEGVNNKDFKSAAEATRFRNLLNKLSLAKLLDVGMEEDISNQRGFNSGIDSWDSVASGMSTLVHKLYQIARYVEAINRIATAKAAFNMANRNPAAYRQLGFKTAEDFAIAMVEDTQGNFSRKDAPMLLKRLPRVMGQFRKYQFMSGWAYANAVNEGFGFKAERGNDGKIKTSWANDEGTRTVGRRTAAFLAAHAFAFGGVRSVPGITILFAMFAALGGDDEPEDIDLSIRKTFGDNALTRGLTQGLLGSAGIDLQSKLSQEHIFSLFPYGDFSTWESSIASVVGPFGALANDWFRGAEELSDGNYIKAWEKFTPKGILTRYPAEVLRYNTEGFTLRDGTPILSPKEIAWYESAAALMGINVGEIARVKRARSVMWEVEKYYDDKENDIRRDYRRASDARDYGEMYQLSKDFLKLQQSKRGFQQFFGNNRKIMKPRSASALTKYDRRRKKLAEDKKDRYDD